jgi:DNA-binding IclR family transcriptional regulator
MLEGLKSGEVVELSQRRLAQAAGIGKSSVNRILHELHEQGALILQTSAAGTRFAAA